LLIRTHIRIALKIAEALGIEDERSIGLFAAGSKLPDDWGNFPHHRGKETEIVKNILSARKLYLQDDDECFAKLGIVLHYIADKWTLAPRTGDKHTKYERTIDKCPVLTNSKLKEELEKTTMPTKSVKAYNELLERIKSDNLTEEDYSFIYSSSRYGRRDLPHEVKLSPAVKVIRLALCRRPTSYGCPIIDFNIAYRVCLNVSKRVLKPLTQTQRKQYEKLARLEKKVWGFPRSYFEKSGALNTMRDVVVARTRIAWASGRPYYVDGCAFVASRENRGLDISLEFADWLQSDSKDPYIQVETVSERVPKKVKVKKRKGLLRRKWVETEEIIQVEKETRVYHIYLEKEISAIGQLGNRITCRSKTVAQYVCQILKATIKRDASSDARFPRSISDFLLYNPDEFEIRSSGTDGVWISGRDRAHRNLNLQPFCNFPVPQNDKRLKEILSKFQRDNETVKQLRTKIFRAFN